MYDAVIVGARCAGSPTAMLLARKGYRVLLVDKAGFPSDTPSTHFVWQAGVARLKRWGLLERLRATNCPAATQISLDLGEIILRGTPPPTDDGVAEAYGPRRMVLDKILADAAVEASTELREHFEVHELSFENGRVTGIRGRTRTDSPMNESARIVIGADGRSSTIARAVKAREYHTSPPLVPACYTYWSGAAGFIHMLDGRELQFRNWSVSILMAYDELLDERVRKFFDKRGLHYEAKRMMGGLCFMVNGKMCVGVEKNRLMARIGLDAYDHSVQLKYSRENI